MDGSRAAPASGNPVQPVSIQDRRNSLTDLNGLILSLHTHTTQVLKSWVDKSCSLSNEARLVSEDAFETGLRDLEATIQELDVMRTRLRQQHVQYPTQALSVYHPSLSGSEQAPSSALFVQTMDPPVVPDVLAPASLSEATSAPIPSRFLWEELSIAEPAALRVQEATAAAAAANQTASTVSSKSASTSSSSSSSSAASASLAALQHTYDPVMETPSVAVGAMHARASTASRYVHNRADQCTVL